MRCKKNYAIQAYSYFFSCLLEIRTLNPKTLRDFINVWSILLTSRKAWLKGPLPGLRHFLTTESPKKRWKMLFISCQKLFLLLRYLHFSPDFQVIYRNGLIKKPRSIPNFMTSQTGQQIIIIQVLPNFSRS